MCAASQQKPQNVSVAPPAGWTLRVKFPFFTLVFLAWSSVKFSDSDTQTLESVALGNAHNNSRQISRHSRQRKTSMPNMTGRPGHWTMEMNGGSSAPYLACTPCVPLFVHCLIRVEAEGLLDYQGRAGIISIVRWNLRPVIFGVENWEIIHSALRRVVALAKCHTVLVSRTYLYSGSKKGPFGKGVFQRSPFSGGSRGCNDSGDFHSIYGDAASGRHWRNSTQRTLPY